MFCNAKRDIIPTEPELLLLLRSLVDDELDDGDFCKLEVKLVVNGSGISEAGEPGESKEELLDLRP